MNNLVYDIMFLISLITFRVRELVFFAQKLTIVQFRVGSGAIVSLSEAL